MEKKDENDTETIDILNNNQTSKESNNIFLTKQGLGISSKIRREWKSFACLETLFNRKRWQLRTDGYLLRKEGSGRNG